MDRERRRLAARAAGLPYSRRAARRAVPANAPATALKTEAAYRHTRIEDSPMSAPANPAAASIGVCAQP